MPVKKKYKKTIKMIL